MGGGGGLNGQVAVSAVGSGRTSSHAAVHHLLPVGAQCLWPPATKVHCWSSPAAYCLRPGTSELCRLRRTYRSVVTPGLRELPLAALGPHRQVVQGERGGEGCHEG